MSALDRMVLNIRVKLDFEPVLFGMPKIELGSCLGKKSHRYAWNALKFDNFHNLNASLLRRFIPTRISSILYHLCVNFVSLKQIF